MFVAVRVRVLLHESGWVVQGYAHSHGDEHEYQDEYEPVDKMSVDELNRPSTKAWDWLGLWPPSPLEKIFERSPQETCWPPP